MVSERLRTGLLCVGLVVALAAYAALELRWNRQEIEILESRMAYSAQMMAGELGAAGLNVHPLPKLTGQFLPDNMVARGAFKWGHYLPSTEEIVMFSRYNVFDEQVLEHPMYGLVYTHGDSTTKHELVHHGVNLLSLEETGEPFPEQGRLARIAVLTEIALTDNGRMYTDGDKLRESWQSFVAENYDELSWYIVTQMVNEGIANCYVQNGVFSDNYVPETDIIRVGTMYGIRDLMHMGGKQLMQPIVSEYGEAGLRHVVKNPPPNDIVTVWGWQQSVLHSLRTQNAN